MEKLATLGTVLISLLTTGGVMIHGAQIDRIAYRSSEIHSSSAPTKLLATDHGLSTETHPHPEHQNTTLRGFAYESPLYPTKERRDKKYMIQNQVPHGRHAFDNYYLPIIG